MHLKNSIDYFSIGGEDKGKLFVYGRSNITNIKLRGLCKTEFTKANAAKRYVADLPHALRGYLFSMFPQVVEKLVFDHEFRL